MQCDVRMDSLSIMEPVYRILEQHSPAYSSNIGMTRYCYPMRCHVCHQFISAAYFNFEEISTAPVTYRIYTPAFYQSDGSNKQQYILAVVEQTESFVHGQICECMLSKTCIYYKCTWSINMFLIQIDFRKQFHQVELYTRTLYWRTTHRNL